MHGRAPSPAARAPVTRAIVFDCNLLTRLSVPPASGS